MKLQIKNMKKLCMLKTFLVGLVMLFGAGGIFAQTEIKVTKIWDKAKHNAFPDLYFFNDYYYCTFREGTSHVDQNNDGQVRIIRSKNLKNWETVAKYALKGIDVREARLSSMPDGRLLVTIAAGVWKNGYESLRPYVSFSNQSGTDFTSLELAKVDPAIPAGLDWIWRVTWNEGVGYGILYKFPLERNSAPWEAYLVSTQDGKNYKKVSQIPIDGNPNESTIRFDAQGKMYVMIRREAGDRMGALATSVYPYTKWSFSSLEWRLGGPNFLFLTDEELIMGSRLHTGQTAQTALFVTDLSGNVKRTIPLPSNGDSSYPGMVIRDGSLHVVYYSSHEGKSSIYLTEIPLADLKARQPTAQVGAGARKVKDVVIYRDSLFYSTFPSVVKKPDGELLVAFRRAPNRNMYGEQNNNHVDHNSYLVGVRSMDGETWTPDPDLIYAHAFGGSQDPCLLQLKDGTLLCASYGWTTVRGDVKVKQPYFESGGFIFLGGYLVRSTDGGKTWEGPYYPPHVAQERHYNVFSEPVPAYNRGALYEAKDGRILWIVAAHDSVKKTSNYLLVSKDKGLTWEYSGVVAEDPAVSFNEASVIETPKGDIVGLLRTAGFDDQAVIARSTDGGKTFHWQSMRFQGHPLNALQLPDGRVLVTYGYRHKPFGIRARILNAECTDWDTAQEIVLRTDGGNGDLGYTWPVQLDENRVLVVYYFNKENGLRHIAGTIMEIDADK